MDADTTVELVALSGPAWAIVWIVIARFAFSLFAPVTAQTVASDSTGTTGNTK